jgi:hypothetical protein
MMDHARDGLSWHMLRQRKLARLLEIVRQTRLERGYIGTQITAQGYSLEQLVAGINASPEAQGGKETVANMRDCMREWREYLAQGGDPNAFQQ